MPTIYGPVDLVKNELRNAVVQNLGSAPSSPVKGLLYYDTASNILYWYNGTGWVAAQGGAGAVPATSVTTQAVGDSPVVGVATTYAREDHKHGRESFGAITAEGTFGSASTNGVAATLARSDHAHGNPVHDAAAHSTIPISALAMATGTVNMNSNLISNLLTPVANADAATKFYVDNLITGLAWKDTVKLASAANSALTGNISVDGVTTAAGDRILLKNQTTPSENGIWIASATAWARATDADSEADLLNAAVFVSQGTVNKDTAWVATTDAPITVGTTGLTWVQFSGAGTYSAGNGLTMTGNVIDVVAGDTSLTVAADSIIVNTAVIATVASVTSALVGYAKRAVQSLAGTSSPEIVTHNLNTRDIILSVYNGATPYTAVQVDWDSTTLNTATVRYNPNLGAGYRCVVIGAG